MTCFIYLNEIEMNKSLYNEWNIVEILPYEDCDTTYWPWYVYEMIEAFSKNPEVEIIRSELHDYQPVWWNKIYYYQYKVRDYRGEIRYVNENWIRPKSTTALFV